MNRKNSKNKGSSFERKTSKDLSLWLTKNDTNDDVFYRSQSSGARFTSRQKMNLTTENQHGDICASNDEGIWFTKIFFIECKHYKEIDLWSLITKNKSGNVVSWWEKIIKESKSISKIPMLIMKQNNKPTLLMTNNDLRHYLTYFNVFYKVSVKFDNLPEAYIYIFKDFLSIDPECLNELLLEKNK